MGDTAPLFREVITQFQCPLTPTHFPTSTIPASRQVPGHRKHRYQRGLGVHTNGQYVQCKQTICFTGINK